MKQFEFRFLDVQGTIVLTRLRSVQDDLDALAEAERLSVTHTIEIWHGSRKVARVKKGSMSPWAKKRLRV